MRTIKVLRTPEDVIKHKSKGDIQESAPAPVPDPTPAAVIPPPPPPPPTKTEETKTEETSGEETKVEETKTEGNEETSGEETKTEEGAQLSFDEMVEDLKNKHNADELKAMATSFGLEVKGNKTDVATAILTKQLEIANTPE